jgi:hypothetical protein
MSSTTATGHRPARGGGMAELIRACTRELSDRIHTDADARARALGWTVSPIPGPAGLGGRVYRDPRFSALRGGDGQ